MIITELYVLLVLFAIKHFLGDYPLQNSYMLRKFAPHWKDWIFPLGAHASVHALFTLAILLAFNVYCYTAQLGQIPYGKIIALAGFDFIIHFTMDRIKASPNLWGRFRTLSPNEMQKALTGLRSHKQNVRLASRRNIKGNQYFWWSLGFDQMVHHLTDITVIYLTFTWGLQ